MTDNNNIEIFEFSKYVQPSILPLISKKWVLNGDNNSFYKYISQCYDGSVTNQAIINGYVSYIYGEGLYDVNGINLSKYISKGDTRLITQDYYTYGAYALQVIWNMAKTAPIQVKYIPVFKLGLNIDHNTMMTTGYWYSFDWEQQTKYKPMFFHKFDGTYKDEDVEIIMVQRPTSKPFFANPSYVSCLEYAELEMELAHSSISHVKNGFQGGTLVNMNNGVPESNELKELYKRKIIDNLTASGNRNKVIVSFNESAEKAITVENLSVPELNQQYVNFDETAERKLIIGHSAPPILFAGSREGGGLGNNAEELKTATQSLYRKHINPMREVIIDGLMDVFRFINPELDLKFKDFEEFDEVITTDNIQ